MTATDSKPRRLQSIDIVRGATVAGMILVNNGHSGSFEALRHAQWNGLTLCDLVFPFFLFIMGVSMFLSMSSRGFATTPAAYGKVVKRSALLFIIGLAINWFDKAVGGNPVCFDTLRYWAVLQRIAICYLVVGLMALSPLRRHMLQWAAALCLVYGLVLWAGHGYAYNADANILARIDRALVGYDHLYHKSPVDPEGLPGTLGSLINVMLGFSCGRLLKNDSSIQAKTADILLFGAVVLMAGYVLSFPLPFNKRIWSPSFALATSGWCALLTGIVTRLVDGHSKEKNIKRDKVWTFFKIFGCNALFLYVFSEILAAVASEIGLSDVWFGLLSDAIPYAPFASLAYALSFVGICFGAGLILFRRHIFIKL